MAVFWASWGRLGGLKSEKMQTVLCENHFFQCRLFGLSELHLALLGSSRPLPGQSSGQDGPRKTPKSDPKLHQKGLQKGSQFWAALGPILGSVLGPKTCPFGGHTFQVFRSNQDLARNIHLFHASMCECFLMFFGSFYFL